MRDFRVSKSAYLREMDTLVAKLGELQEKLAADKRWGVLIILQGMDTSGKDGVIKAVTTGVNPAGFQVFSFKKPTAKELQHDWMWRTSIAQPEKGRIGIFNRSQYEELTAVRVHPEFLANQMIPFKNRGKNFWKGRSKALVANEEQLHAAGIKTLKFFLHVSKDEQARRLIERAKDPKKLWKFDVNDLRERDHWDGYQDAWSDAIKRTSSKDSPWFVIPADDKRAARIAIAKIVIKELGELGLEFPKLPTKDKREIAAGIRKLEAELRRQS